MERVRGFFVQKFWVLPVWAWAGILLALILGYMYWKKIGIFGGSAGSADPGSGSSSGGAQASFDSGGGGGGGVGGGDTAPPIYTPVSGNGSNAMLPSAPISDISSTSYSVSGGPEAPPVTVAPAANYTSSGLYRQPIYPVEAPQTAYLPAVQPFVAFNPVRARTSGNQAIV